MHVSLRGILAIVVRQRPVLSCLLILLAMASVVSFWTGTTRHYRILPSAKGGDSSPAWPYGKDYKGSSGTAGISRATNTSLGFSKIFVVSLPERSDKRDALVLTAALTGFDVEWVDGVRGEAIPDRALPSGIDRVKLMETNLGSWRAHMNAVRRIVEENIESALIMEDDVDWDIRLKPQLEEIARGTRSILSRLPAKFSPRSSPNSQPLDSPFGNGWDVLWLGHCGEHFAEEMDENKGLAEDDPARIAMSLKHTMANDVTVPPADHLTGGAIDFKAYPEFTRWVHVTAAPICTFAYALSQNGARRVLFDLSVDRLGGPFDNALSWLCQRAVGSWSKLSGPESASQFPEQDTIVTDKNDLGLLSTCLSVTPPVFFHHRSKGLVSSDSDIQAPGSEKKVRPKGFTENIVWSARNNLRNMLLGRSTMESQF